MIVDELLVIDLPACAAAKNVIYYVGFSLRISCNFWTDYKGTLSLLLCYPDHSWSFSQIWTWTGSLLLVIGQRPGIGG